MPTDLSLLFFFLFLSQSLFIFLSFRTHVRIYVGSFSLAILSLHPDIAEDKQISGVLIRVENLKSGNHCLDTGTEFEWLFVKKTKNKKKNFIMNVCNHQCRHCMKIIWLLNLQQHSQLNALDASWKWVWNQYDERQMPFYWNVRASYALQERKKKKPWRVFFWMNCSFETTTFDESVKIYIHEFWLIKPT